MLKDKLARLQKISYNLKSELELFVEEYVKLEGIKDVMMLIEES